MSMTKKHFEAISNIIAHSTTEEHGGLINKRLFVGTLSQYFKELNPNFNTEMFADACFKEPNDRR